MTTETGYTHSEAFDSGYLQVDDIHTIHYSQFGLPHGKPVLFLHGGPGAGCQKSDTVFFDPSLFRVVLPDQRGAGHSLPAGSLRNNTTAALVSDIEVLRAALGVRKWHTVFGGSWGSTLGLAYAQTHPERCGALVLRGVFLGTREENERHARCTADMFPDAYDRYCGFVAEEKRGDVVGAYHELVAAGDGALARRAAFEFERPEVLSAAIQEGGMGDEGCEWAGGEEGKVAEVRVLTHYMLNACFLGAGELLEGCERIKHIPVRIAQGRVDIICPPRAAFELSKRLPKSELHWLRRSGHSAKEPDTLRKLVQFCDELGQEDYHLQ